jgi:hypothetical protein
MVDNTKHSSKHETLKHRYDRLGPDLGQDDNISYLKSINDILVKYKFSSET